jgi:hypothetical protein
MDTNLPSAVKPGMSMAPAHDALSGGRAHKVQVS